MGEKSLSVDYYTTGQGGDNETMYTGFDHDTVRCVNPAYLLTQDLSGWDGPYQFGSAHSVGFYMAFCDGSVQMISYSVEKEVHRRLGVRNDGLTVDAKKL